MSKRREQAKRHPETAVAITASSGELAADSRGLIEAARLRVAQTVNSELVLLHWQIGCRIRLDILNAQYGDEIVSTLSRQLTIERGLWRRLQPPEPFPHDPLRRGLAGRSPGHHARATPRLEPLQRNPVP